MASSSARRVLLAPLLIASTASARRALLVPLLATAACAAALAADLHESCRTWAESGECESNPQYMQENCASSCAGASGYKSQMRRECEGYAKQGECSRNPAFMLGTCRAQCDAWEREHGLRIDRNPSCVEWSILGKCEREPERMAAECNTSCTVHERCARSSFTGWSVGVCDKALRCEARDKRTDCAARAAAGECAADPRRMAIDCLQSCSAADVDAVLAAQRPEMRAILSPLYDVPVTPPQGWNL